MQRIGFALILILSWGLPLFGLINNRLYPSYGSALGVAYALGIGCLIHVVLFVGWLIYRRSNCNVTELAVLFSSTSFLIALTSIGNTGSLSVF